VLDFNSTNVRSHQIVFGYLTRRTRVIPNSDYHGREGFPITATIVLMAADRTASTAGLLPAGKVGASIEKALVTLRSRRATYQLALVQMGQSQSIQNA